MTYSQFSHLQAYTKTITQTGEAHLNYPPWQINHKLTSIRPHQYKGFE